MSIENYVVLYINIYLLIWVNSYICKIKKGNFILIYLLVKVFIRILDRLGIIVNKDCGFRNRFLWIIILILFGLLLRSVNIWLVYDFFIICIRSFILCFSCI